MINTCCPYRIRTNMQKTYDIVHCCPSRSSTAALSPIRWMDCFLLHQSEIHMRLWQQHLIISCNVPYHLRIFQLIAVYPNQVNAFLDKVVLDDVFRSKAPLLYLRLVCENPPPYRSTNYSVISWTSWTCLSWAFVWCRMFRNLATQFSCLLMWNNASACASYEVSLFGFCGVCLYTYIYIECTTSFLLSSFS